VSAFVINPYAFAGKFAPTDVSGLQVWLDANVGIFDAATGGGLVTTDSASVARWEDQSGNANHFTQTASTNRPILKTSIQNGLNVLRLALNKLMVCSNNAIARNVGGVTVFAVRKCAANPTSEQNIFRANIATGSPSRVFFAVGFTSGKANAGGRRLDASGFQGIASSSNVSTTAFEMQSAVYDYTNADLFLYLNDVLEASSTTWQTSGNTSDTDSFQIRVGALNGDIGEVIVYNRALTSTERESVWSYLNAKWDLY
jgi:hypothetical protein